MTWDVTFMLWPNYLIITLNFVLMDNFCPCFIDTWIDRNIYLNIIYEEIQQLVNNIFCGFILAFPCHIFFNSSCRNNLLTYLLDDSIKAFFRNLNFEQIQSSEKKDIWFIKYSLAYARQKRFTWYCTHFIKIGSWSPGAGFIPIICTNGINQIKKWKL